MSLQERSCRLLDEKGPIGEILSLKAIPHNVWPGNLVVTFERFTSCDYAELHISISHI